MASAGFGGKGVWKMKNVKVSGTLGSDKCPVGVGLVGLVPRRLGAS